MKKDSKYLISALSLTMALMASAAPTKASAAEWRVQPALSVEETYTDNVELDNAAKESDWITTVTPSVSISGQGARLQASIFYSAAYLYFARSDTQRDDLRHNLSANLSTELINDYLFVDAGAGISQEFLDRRAAISGSDANITENRATVQNYRISPYAVYHFEDFANAVLRYQFSHQRSSDDRQINNTGVSFTDSTEHVASFTLSSGRRFNRLGWDLTTVYSHEDRSTLFENNESYSAPLGLSYRVSRYLTLLASGGYQDNSGSGDLANRTGETWDVGFILTPGPRSSVSVRYGRQYEDDSFSVNASYRFSPQTALTVTYRDILTTSQGSLRDRVLASNDQVGESVRFITLNDAVTREKRWQAVLTGERGRNSFSISAFHEKVLADATANQEKAWGGSVSWSRQINRRLTSAVSANYDNSRFETALDDDIFWSASASLTYQISQSINSSLRYTYTDREGDINTTALTENSVSLSVSASF